jgi:hypothetical protein
MGRKSSSSLSRWLLATAFLIAASAGGVFFAGAAAACAPGAGGPCVQPNPAGWKPVLVDFREQKAQLEAKRFADRVKRHLGRQFAKRKQQFERHLVRIEKRRRVHKRHSKALQFAAARRHAAKHVRKLHRALGAKPMRVGFKKPPHRQASGSGARPVVHWRSLWRHDAHNDAQPPQRAE